MVKRGAWLSITPEPERELPWAVATLDRGRPATPAEVGGEDAKIERLILRGSQAQWLRYLHTVIDLIERTPEDGEGELARARQTAIAVLANHHNLLLGLPGRASEKAAVDRARLGRLTNHT